MKKEVLIAIITGFALGLLITFGLWTANKNFKNSTSDKPTPEVSIITPTPAPSKSELSLTIFSPEDNLLSDQEEIEVSGKTAPTAVIVILYPDGEKILEADSEGGFKTMIILAGGSNEIEITAYDDSGNEISQIVNVVYSTAEI